MKFWAAPGPTVGYLHHPFQHGGKTFIEGSYILPTTRGMKVILHTSLTVAHIATSSVHVACTEMVGRLANLIELTVYKLQNFLFTYSSPEPCTAMSKLSVLAEQRNMWEVADGVLFMSCLCQQWGCSIISLYSLTEGNPQVRDHKASSPVLLSPSLAGSDHSLVRYGFFLPIIPNCSNEGH